MKALRRINCLLLVVGGLILCSPGTPARAGVLVPVLRFFGNWLAGRLLDGFVDRYVLGQQTQTVQREIVQASEQSAVELEQARAAASRAAAEDKEKLLELVSQLESRLVVIDEARQFISEFNSYVTSHRMTDQELVSFCRNQLQNRIRPLENRLDLIETRVSKLEQDVTALKVELDQLHSSLNAQPVLGFYYNGLKLFPRTWNGRYQYLPENSSPSRIVSGLGVSLGLWVNRIFYIESLAHYIWEQREEVRTDENTVLGTSIEGLGWSVRGVATIRLSGDLFFNVGGGYAWHNYEVALSGPSIPVSPESRIASRHRLGDPFVLLGFRVGQKGFYLVGDMELLYRSLTLQGYYLKCGINVLL